MRTTFLAPLLLAPSLVLADVLGPGQDAVAYCERYRPDLVQVKACLERQIDKVRLKQKALLDQANQIAAERERHSLEIEARIARLRLRAAEAEVKRLIPLPLHRQREEIARMDPEIGAIVAQRLGLDGR